MQLSIRWLRYQERDLIKDLACEIYTHKKENYPVNLAGNSEVYDLFLLSPTTIGWESRRVAVAVDETGKIHAAVGVRELHAMPAWLLSWTLSSVSSASFIKVWKKMIKFLCEHYEAKGINEMYVVNPVDREEAYRRLMLFMRDKYWTFIETTVNHGNRCNYSLYYAFMGYTAYTYDINIRRYILKRGHDV